MNCLNCDGSLVFRQTHEYPLDDNGVCHIGDEFTIEDYGVFCSTCGAKHKYDTILDQGDTVTIALVKGDPEPVATLAITYANGVILHMDSEMALALIVIDEDKEEVGRFMVHPIEDSAFLTYANDLARSIPKGEWKTSFRRQDNDD